MRIGKIRFRLGLRTLKTAFSVFLCILFYHLTHYGSPMITAGSAVFAMREDISSSLSFGKSRIIGNTTGGIAALSYFFLEQYIPNQFTLQAVAIPALIVCIIIVLDGLDNNVGIIGAVATFLIIALSIPSGDKINYAFERVIDTFIGTFIAMGVNSFIKRPEQTIIMNNLERQINDLQHQLDELKQRQREEKDSKK